MRPNEPLWGQKRKSSERANVVRSTKADVAALLGLEPLAAALAVVEKLTRVGEDRLTGLMTTVGAGNIRTDCRFMLVPPLGAYHC
jgi:hypothetical protein